MSFDVQRLDQFQTLDIRECAHAREDGVILVGGADEIMHHHDLAACDRQRVERADLSVGNGLEKLIAGAELGACHRLVVGHTLGHSRRQAVSSGSGAVERRYNILHTQSLTRIIYNSWKRIRRANRHGRSSSAVPDVRVIERSHAGSGYS